jgi:aminomethyltransferase
LSDAPATPLKTTPLNALHRSLGARLVGFAGYEMPVSFPAGILREHQQCRTQAALFDVSHMGQIRLSGRAAAERLESLVPGDISGLAPGRMRYTQFTNDGGGILDDLMVTRDGDSLLLVVNAARKDEDLARLKAGLGGGVVIEPLGERALLALQGPSAAAVMGRIAEPLTRLGFMQGTAATIEGIACFATRSGYTGEDGFEISIPAAQAAAVAERLLAEPEVAPAGLGARDSLRLEAGLCLYGHDIEESTSPVEAGLAWSIGKRRREQGGFPGARRIVEEILHGPARKRIGIRLQGRIPAREGAAILDAAGHEIGRITSGGVGPSAGAPIAMGYVVAAQAHIGATVSLLVRGEPRPGTVVALPFVPHRYAKSSN